MREAAVAIGLRVLAPSFHVQPFLCGIFRSKCLEGLLAVFSQAFILQRNGLKVHGRRVQATPIAR